MYRIRFHGRGGQGVKTASRLLGTAFFHEGYQVQDAPRYGAERRGAPVFAYVRADRRPIYERGIIQRPDLVVVADDSLMPVPAAGVMAGLDARSVLLIITNVPAHEWRDRLALDCTLLTLPSSREADDPLDAKYVGASTAGAAAGLLAVISKQALEQAVRDEVGTLGEEVLARNLSAALGSYELMAANAGSVAEGVEADASNYEPPSWIDLPFDDARVAAPAIHAPLTSVQVRTGLWRTMRPIIEHERCNRCWWVCSSLCPDSAITVPQSGYPEIDYDHCKGCMICVAQCPAHAIVTQPEATADTASETQA